MPTETIYQPPDGEGPSVVRETRMTCGDCRHLVRPETTNPNDSFACRHPSKTWGGLVVTFLGLRQQGTPTTPSWCPIVSAAPEEWAKRMRT
jgi:hypothetical protein